jgi:hypothetical protein
MTDWGDGHPGNISLPGREQEDFLGKLTSAAGCEIESCIIYDYCRLGGKREGTVRIVDSMRGREGGTTGCPHKT